MSFIQELYLKKKREIESKVRADMVKDGVPPKFVANKILNLYFEEHKNDDLRMSSGRLNRLTLLVDLIYRKENLCNPLLSRSYVVSDKGLLNMDVMCEYGFFYKDEEIWKEIFIRKESRYQKYIESCVDPVLNGIINKIVRRVYEGTRFVDNVDLRNMLNSDQIQKFKFDFIEFDISDGHLDIPKEIVTELFQDFDFSKFEELNESERLKYWVKN